MRCAALLQTLNGAGKFVSDKPEVKGNKLNRALFADSKTFGFPGLPSPTQPFCPGLQFPQVMFPNLSIRMKGTTGLIVAAAIIIAVLIAFPAYRVFFGISVV